MNGSNEPPSFDIIANKPSKKEQHFLAYRHELAQTFIHAYIYLDLFIGTYNLLSSGELPDRNRKLFANIAVGAFKESAVLRCARFFDPIRNAISLNGFLDVINCIAGCFKGASAQEIRDYIKEDREKIASRSDDFKRSRNGVIRGSPIRARS